MRRCWRHSLPIFVLVVVFTGSTVLGQPSVEIGNPTDGSVVLTRSYNVTGYSNGSNASWFQGVGAGFDTGISDEVVSDPALGLQIARMVSDDFEDNSFNTSKWGRTNQAGIFATEESMGLSIRGKSTASSQWMGFSRVISSKSIMMSVEATLTSFTGTGSGYSTGLYLYVDDSNYIGILEHYDTAIGFELNLTYDCMIDAVPLTVQLDPVLSHPHTYRFIVSSTKVNLYQDNFEITSINASLNGPKIMFVGTAKQSGDTLVARWDDVRSEYSSAGSLTSTVYDTRSVNPVLVGVELNVTLPADTAILLEVRSCPDIDMSTATAWTRVTSSQTTDLPEVARYIQFRIKLSTSNLSSSPTVWNVTIIYDKPVVRVELKVGNETDWVLAHGTQRWWAMLDLSENTTQIWARVTDVSDDTKIVFVQVEVDTTPPEGGILIDHGATRTTSNDVEVSLTATDRYGVSQMIVSERDDLTDALWRPFSNELGFTLGPGDGTKTVYVRFMDLHGHVSRIYSDTILLDTQPPVGMLVIEDGMNYTNTTEVHLSLTADDPSGVTDVILSERIDFSGVSWLPFNETMVFTLNPLQGEKRVYASFRDSLGHVSVPVSDSITLDQIGPVLSFTINNGDPYTGSRAVLVVMMVSETDRNADIQVGEDPLMVEAPHEAFRPSFSLVLSPGDGRKTVYARAWDVAGNVGQTANASIVVDSVPPIVRIVLNGGAEYTTSSSVTVSLEVEDASMISTMELGEDASLSGALVESYRPMLGFVLTSAEGLKTVLVRVRDVAGNLGPIASAMIILDRTPPGLALAVVGGARYTMDRNITLSLSAIDAVGVARMQLSEDPSFVNSPYVMFANLTPWTLSSGDGAKMVYGRITDLSGNLGQIMSCSIILDTVAPRSAMNPIQNISEGTELEISWGGIDVTSGIWTFDVQYRDGDGPWTELVTTNTSLSTTVNGEEGHSYSFRVRARDLAGNEGPYPEAVLNSVLISVPEVDNGLSKSILVIMLVVGAIGVCLVAGYIMLRARRRS